MRTLKGIGAFASIIGFGILSFILIHVFAVFGLFVAVGYSVWWLFAPRYTACMICRVRKSGEWCRICNAKVEGDSSRNPRSLRSVFLNSSIIAAISIVCIGVVFLEARVLHFLGFPPTEKTVTVSLPTRGEQEVGEVFPVAITIAGIETPVNAVRADLGFPPETLEAVEVTTERSFATVFVQKEIDNKTGVIRIAGGLPNPGFAGPSGLFATAYFRSKVPGVANVDFLSSSVVLANDGRGTNVIKNLASTSYFIVPSSLKTPRVGTPSATQEIELSRAETTGTQMHLYDEEEVLGESTVLPEASETEESIAMRALYLLQQIDHTILSLWSKLLLF